MELSPHLAARFETLQNRYPVKRSALIPMLLYAFSFQWLGFYLATGMYMGFFAAYLGRYRIQWIVASAVITPLAIFLIFEVAFRLLLPKSIFYPGIPF